MINPEDYKTPEEYVRACAPQASCFEANVAWQGTEIRQRWLASLSPVESFSYSYGDSEEQAWERAAWKLAYEQQKQRIAQLERLNVLMVELLKTSKAMLLYHAKTERGTMRGVCTACNSAPHMPDCRLLDLYTQIDLALSQQEKV